MAGCKVIKFKGEEIVYTDMSGCNVKEACELVERSQQMVSAYPKKSVLSLVNVQDMQVNSALLKKVNENVSKNNLHVIATVVIGLNAFKRALIDTITTITGRNIVTLESYEEALLWLHDAKTKSLNKDQSFSSNGESDN